MGSLMGASFSRVFESMGVRLGRMTVYRHETSAQRRITPVALFALRPDYGAAGRISAVKRRRSGVVTVAGSGASSLLR
ncbi:hypothetical protein, partial [Pseudomonas aeruginosa]|uniref:hypothetical protein n=9 Tax=Pseudomonas TaxID=286 RepID=UPI000E30B4D0